MVPSSPNVPCRTGKITSTSMGWWAAFCETAPLSNGTKEWRAPEGSGGTITESPRASTAAPTVVSGSPARR